MRFIHPSGVSIRVVRSEAVNAAAVTKMSGGSFSFKGTQLIFTNDARISMTDGTPIATIKMTTPEWHEICAGPSLVTVVLYSPAFIANQSGFPVTGSLSDFCSDVTRPIKEEIPLAASCNYPVSWWSGFTNSAGDQPDSTTLVPRTGSSLITIPRMGVSVLRDVNTDATFDSVPATLELRRISASVARGTGSTKGFWFNLNFSPLVLSSTSTLMLLTAPQPLFLLFKFNLDGGAEARRLPCLVAGDISPFLLTPGRLLSFLIAFQNQAVLGLAPSAALPAGARCVVYLVSQADSGLSLFASVDSAGAQITAPTVVKTEGSYSECLRYVPAHGSGDVYAGAGWAGLGGGPTLTPPGGSSVPPVTPPGWPGGGDPPLTFSKRSV